MITFLPFILFMLVIVLSKAISLGITKISKLITVFFIIIGLIGIFIITKPVVQTYLLKNIHIDTDTETAAKADGFTIDAYKVYLDISESNVISVTEDITINFYETGHHGIYKFTPLWYPYTTKDNITKSRKAELTNLRCESETYTVDTVKDKPRIKVGSAYSTLPIGPHNYIIKYDYDMGNDIYKGFDEFIFHAFGDYWGTRINNAELVIALPKSFDANNIHFFSDKYRKNDITNQIDYTIIDNIIYAKVKNTFYLDKSLTFDIELPDNYFQTGTNNYGYKSLTLCLSIIGFTIITFLLWLKYGKNYKYFETVELYPPDNLDASEIGYIYKGMGGNKLAISLIVELASKGLIKIHELPDKTRIIVNEYTRNQTREIYAVKLSDYNVTSDKEEDVRNKIEFNELFKNGRLICINNDFNTYLPILNKFSTMGYIKILKDNYNDNNKNQEILNNLTPNESIVYQHLFPTKDANILSEDREFYKVFSEIDTSLTSKYEKLLNDKKADIFQILSSILFMLSPLMFYFAFTVYKDLNTIYSILYLISYSSMLVTLIFTIVMPRKTPYAEKLKIRIKGFKHYLETAEKNNIELEVMKNPNYFYDILPYAYVLGVSKLWISKFENIPLPPRDMGNFDYTSMTSFNDLSDHIYYPIPTSSSSSSSSSSGCSSCGGGCSSCGGGCSSCGGGGSW